MTETEIEKIAGECRDALVGRSLARVFQLSATSLAIDFEPHAGAYLFIDIARSKRAAYLIARKRKDLERSAIHPSRFAIQLMRYVPNFRLVEIKSATNGLCLEFEDAFGNKMTIRIDLETRHPNVFILSTGGDTVATMHESEPSMDTASYARRTTSEERSAADLQGRTLSEILDENSRAADDRKRFLLLAAQARRSLSRELNKRLRLLQNLEDDLKKHGDAEEWKRYGDLILAGLSSVERGENYLAVTDLFDPQQQTIRIPAETDKMPTEIAEGYYRKYAKARNGVAAIESRKAVAHVEITEIKAKIANLEAAIREQDERKIAEFVPRKPQQAVDKAKSKTTAEFKGARNFTSSGGFSILVGKKAADNDYLSFRIAKPYDTWLHAADYPGSHVLIRNPTRKEIPVNTLIEAAELAAFYSEARDHPKAAVKYTLKKFVNKPKRSAPGLASLSSFKTILVEPRVPPTVTNDRD